MPSRRWWASTTASRSSLLPCTRAEEAIALAQEHLPDVVLMDIVFKSGGMGGIEATR